MSWDLRSILFEPREGRIYTNAIVTSPTGRKIELTESPAGRNLYVWVNGVEYKPVAKVNWSDVV